MKVDLQSNSIEFYKFQNDYPEYYYLFKRLQENRYSPELEFDERQNYFFCHFNSQGVRGGFCTPNEYSYPILNGYFVADHSQVFDKWSKCPVSIKVKWKNFYRIFHWIEVLKTKTGKKASNEFDHDFFANARDYR